MQEWESKVVVVAAAAARGSMLMTDTIILMPLVLFFAPSLQPRAFSGDGGESHVGCRLKFLSTGFGKMARFSVAYSLKLL